MSSEQRPRLAQQWRDELAARTADQRRERALAQPQDIAVESDPVAVVDEAFRGTSWPQESTSLGTELELLRDIAGAAILMLAVCPADDDTTKAYRGAVAHFKVCVARLHAHDTRPSSSLPTESK